MSPRTTDSVVPGEHDLRGVPSFPAAQVVLQRAPSSTASGACHEPDNGVTPLSLQRHRRKAKPLSSGWKSLAWTKPPTTELHGMTPISSSRQRQRHPAVRMAAAGAHPGISSTEYIVAPVDPGSTTAQAAISADKNGTPEHQPPQSSTRRRSREVYLAGISESPSGSGGSRSSLPRNFQRTGVAAEFMISAPERQFIQAARSAEFSQSRGVNAMAESMQSQLQPMEAGQPQGGLAPRYQDAPALDEISKSMPNQHRRESSVDTDANAVQVERSLSDSSIVTGSDFGPKMTSNINRPTILTEMKDEDAIAALATLLGKGKGMPVVKHAVASGGSKSRKFLKFNEKEGLLVLCGMLRPYFKTKISVRDIDRVDAKWCCVVVHAKGRSPLRLEVDSCATADLLRVGLMAASQVEPTPPIDPFLPPPSPVAEEEEQQQQPDAEQGLSSVRPGHRSSQVYDPDAALSVAALLAKEMEEERSRTGGALWSSERAASRPGGTPEPARATKPVLRRSVSMTSVESSSAANTAVEATAMNRRSLPRNNAYGSGLDAAGEISKIDTKAALRRLYGAIEGRGMAAVKRGPNGKGRSRVMIRSRAREGTVGWAHVLPPFSRKFVAANMLVGASRSSRVVTLHFKGREPVLFETDRLTDALILEQGFVSLAEIQNARF